ncbi:MAG: MBOAT family protein [Lachnospiraceae bacterium]|nr:MBOAT family protein [Lachnospiraceae bacterium]
MVFSSLVFLFLFLPLSVLAYFLVPGLKLKNRVLLVFSLVFYAWGEPVYILLMLFSILMNYALGILMEDDPGKKKRTLAFAVFANLVVLGFYKYYGFLMTTVNGLFGTSFRIHEIPLPIGISFYTFQALGYLIDLYRGKFKAQRNVLDFGLYISMYFQLIAGPIVRYQDVERQLHEREITLTRLGKGLSVFLFGLGKKVLLANTAGALFKAVQAMGPQVSTASAWLGAIAYMLQIYFDFSGYSDMAIGLALAFGFDFPVNFDRPYLSGSVTEFWRRWHISLGTWFRDYVYIPLGGSRVRAWRQVLNRAVVWALTGLWHGASWNFVVWGLFHGLVLTAERFFLKKKPLPAVPGRLLTLLLVLVGWVFFSSGTLPDALMTLRAMAGFAKGGLADKTALGLLANHGAALAAGIVCCLPFAGKLRDRLLEKHRILLLLTVLLILLLSTVFLVTDTYNPFLYFRF